MKPPSIPQLFLLVTLPCAGFGAAWFLAQRRAPVPAAPPPAAAPVRALVAERRPLTPEPALSVHGSEPVPAASALAPFVELNNEAITNLTSGELAVAVEKFERCLAAEPDNATFAGNLAEALVRLARSEHDRGELEPAIAHLARAIELGRARADAEVLARILERWRRELELGRDDWTESSSRFELTYDTDRDDILHHSHEVLEHLERSYDELVLWFGRDPLAGGPPVRVVLYEPEDFGRLTGLGDWAAGLFDGVVRVSVRELTAGQGWRAVLVHELVHAFVHAIAGPDVPGWLNEGLAQLLEPRRSEVALLRERLRGTEPFPLEKLAGSLASWEDESAIARAYAQSLVFVVDLRASYGDEALRRMLAGRERGLSIAAAFEEWTSVSRVVAVPDGRESLMRCGSGAGTPRSGVPAPDSRDRPRGARSARAPLFPPSPSTRTPRASPASRTKKQATGTSRLLHARESRFARWLQAAPTESVSPSRMPGEWPVVQEEHDGCRHEPVSSDAFALPPRVEAANTSPV